MITSQDNALSGVSAAQAPLGAPVLLAQADTAATAAVADAGAKAPLAVLTGASSGVEIVRGGSRIPVTSEQALMVGDKVIVPKDGSANVVFPSPGGNKAPLTGVFSGGTEAVIGQRSLAAGVDQVQVDMVSGELFMGATEAQDIASVAVKKPGSSGLAGAGLGALGLLGLAGLARHNGNDGNNGNGGGDGTGTGTGTPGPAGPAGPAGAAGATGPAGATGATGATGAAGQSFGLIDQQLLDTVNAGGALNPLVGVGGLAGDTGPLDNLTSGALVDNRGLILDTGAAGGGLGGVGGGSAAAGGLTGLLGGLGGAGGASGLTGALGGLGGAGTAAGGLPIAMPGANSGLVDQQLLDAVNGLTGNALSPVVGVGGAAGDTGPVDNLLGGALVANNGLLLPVDGVLGGAGTSGLTGLLGGLGGSGLPLPTGTSAASAADPTSALTSLPVVGELVSTVLGNAPAPLAGALPLGGETPTLPTSVPHLDTSALQAITSLPTTLTQVLGSHNLPL